MDTTYSSFRLYVTTSAYNTNLYLSFTPEVHQLVALCKIFC